MPEQIILGIIQGICEWLPISSEGMIVLTAKNLFNGQSSAETIIRQALFLHLGTFLAALIYFRKEVFSLTRSLFKYKSADCETRKVLNFLIIATLLSGVLGFGLLKLFVGLEAQMRLSGRIITLAIGLLLLITAGLQIRAKKNGCKSAGDLANKDSFLLGFVQGLAVLPGLSRSGLTVSALLLRKFDDAVALRMSFLMSLPIVLAGNIVFNLEYLKFSSEAIWGLAFSFVFGLLTIDLLLKIARKVNFGYFVLVFGALVIISVFV